MAGRGSPTAIYRSDAQICRARHPRHSRRSNAPAASDRSAPMRCATRPGARQHSPPDVEIVGGEVSCGLAEFKTLGLKYRFSSGRRQEGDKRSRRVLLIAGSTDTSGKQSVVLNGSWQRPDELDARLSQDFADLIESDLRLS